MGNMLRLLVILVGLVTAFWALHVLFHLLILLFWVALAAMIAVGALHLSTPARRRRSRSRT